MAKSMHDYLEENLLMMNDLAKEMRFVQSESKAEVKENPLAGKSICVTGKLINFTRDSINEKITSIGAIAVSSVSKKTNYLLTNEANGSSKYKKAVELNIPILSENEFIKLIGG